MIAPQPTYRQVSADTVLFVLPGDVESQVLNYHVFNQTVWRVNAAIAELFFKKEMDCYEIAELINIPIDYVIDFVRDEISCHKRLEQFYPASLKDSLEMLHA